MNNYIRLTYCEDGHYGVCGMNESNESNKLYGCVTKLKDYENLLLQPSEIGFLISALLDCRTLNDIELHDVLNRTRSLIISREG